jgi:hypothetical protein
LQAKGRVELISITFDMYYIDKRLFVKGSIPFMAAFRTNQDFYRSP